MAMDHAVWIYNHLPRMDSGASPEELWTRSNTVTSRLLSDCHVWGSPTYVLEPKLQKSGVKIPKWRPRSRRGVNMGFSPRHSTMVALVLNLVTSTITPQFHVVFDDMFSAVTSNDPSEIWGRLIDCASFRLNALVDDDADVEIHDEWRNMDE